MSTALSNSENIWSLDSSGSFIQIEAWRSNGLVHGFHLGGPDLKSKDTSIWLEGNSASSLRLLSQTHSSIVHTSEQNGELPEGDGWFLSEIEIGGAAKNGYGVLSADCAPVILFSATEKKAAVLHSGWRGTVKNIVAEAVSRFESINELQMAVGPCAGVCCYEFDQAAVYEHFPDWVTLDGVYQNGNLSIKTILEAQALEVGLKKESILISKVCTICDSRCYSFRRQGANSGRQLSFLVV